MKEMADINGSTVISDKQHWDEFYHRLPAHLRDINFAFDYFHLFEVCGNGKPHLFSMVRDDQIFFYPFLKRSIESEVLDNTYFDIESAYGYSGPVATSNDEGFLLHCTQSFREYCRENKIVTEFIRFHPFIENNKLAIQDEDLSVVPLRDYVYVDLQKSEQEIWDSYTSQNRNKIRKAEKNGIEIIHDYACKYFDDFVRIYRQNMEQLNASGAYFFSKEFFTSLKELIIKSGLLLIARNKSEVLGASAFLLGNTWAHYFLSSATGDGKKLAVSNLLLSKGINYSKKAGMKKIHLGGGMTDAADDPLLVFKRNFSPDTTKFYIGKRVHLKEQYDLLCRDWDDRFAPVSLKYKNILQRYRWKKSDLL